MTVVRGFSSALLLALGLLLVAVAVPAVWVDRHVLETDPYTEAVAPLIGEPVVQEQVAAALAAPISTRLDLAPALDRLLVEATTKVVATDGFARVWTDAVRISHRQAVEGLRDEGTGINLVEDGIVVDQAALIEALRPQLAEAGLPFADRIPALEGTVVLAAGPDVARAATVARAVDRWATWLAVGAPVLLVMGVLLAAHRPRALVMAGLGLLAVAGMLWVGLGLGAETTGLLLEVGDQRPTALLLWESLAVAPLRPMVTGVGIAGVATVGLGSLAWLVRR